MPAIRCEIRRRCVGAPRPPASTAPARMIAMSPPTPLRLAVTGKGGSGKSMIAATVARILARRGHSVLAINSDLMGGLPGSLGAARSSEPALTAAVEKGEDGRWRFKEDIGPARAVRQFSIAAPDGVLMLDCGYLPADDRGPLDASILAFGHMVRALQAQASSFRDLTLVGDLPAGPGPTARDWAPFADMFLVVVEPTWKSALTALRVARIVRSRRAAPALFVANKTAGADLRPAEAYLGEAVFATIPADAAVREADRAGVAPLDHDPSSPAMRAIERMVEQLECGHRAAGAVP